MSQLHDEFSTMVTALAKPGQNILDTLTPNDCHILHMAVGVSGESGELLDAIKKSVIYRKELDMTNVIEEIGDILFFIEGLCQGLNITQETCVQANIKKLGKRYGEIYSDEAAQLRADKQTHN
jgi:NTP pyrophosphatase (non-canonical NTP hydrolase)